MDNRTNGDEAYVDLGGRILAGPMNKEAAIEYVLEHSPLSVTHKTELNPICPTCGTVEEVAVRSSNIEGYLCPVCDDPTVKFVE